MNLNQWRSFSIEIGFYLCGTKTVNLQTLPHRNLGASSSAPVDQIAHRNLWKPIGTDRSVLYVPNERGTRTGADQFKALTLPKPYRFPARSNRISAAG